MAWNWVHFTSSLLPPVVVIGLFVTGIVEVVPNIRCAVTCGKKGLQKGEIVLQIPAAIAIVLAKVDVKKPKAEIGIGIERKVVKEFDSNVDNVLVHLPNFLN